jgi:hypothetical protein
MMRTAKIIGVAVAACLALAAAASGASAAELAITTGQAYPQEFLGEATSPPEAVLTNTFNGNEVKCGNTLIKGVLNSPTDALVLLLFHKCTAKVSGVTVNCTTSGEPTGLIHSALLALPVWLDKAKTKPGLLFEKEGTALLAKFTCGGLVTIEVRGSVVAAITEPPAKTKSNHMTVSAEVEGTGTAAKQKFTKVEEGAAEFILESNENGGAFHRSTEKLEGGKIHFTNAAVEAEFR